MLPDHDKAGRDHADAVARSLVGKAARIRLLELPGLADKGDASDWFAAGGTVEAFNALVDQAPDWTDNGTQASDETPQHNGRILRGTEFADLSTSSRKVWLVHHLLAIGEISVWYGEPGSGKSVGIEDLGLHVAVGRAWHGRQVKQCAVLYVALERANVVQRRAIAWGLEHGLLREQLPFKVIRGPLDFRDPQVAADIVATLEDLARRHGCEAGLIIVDTVSRALCGGDENSPEGHGRPDRQYRPHSVGHRRPHRPDAPSAGRRQGTHARAWGVAWGRRYHGACRQQGRHAARRGGEVERP